MIFKKRDRLQKSQSFKRVGKKTPKRAPVGRKLAKGRIGEGGILIAVNLNRYHPSLLEQDLHRQGALGSEFQREVLQDEQSFITYLNSFDLKDQFVGEEGQLILKNLPPDAESFLLLLHRRLGESQIQNLVYAPPRLDAPRLDAQRQGGELFASARRYTDQIFSTGSGRTGGTQADPTRRERELTDLLMDLRDDFFDAILGAGTNEQNLESVFVRLEEVMARYERSDLKQKFKTLVVDDPRAGKYSGTGSIEDILEQELSGRKLGRMTALATLPDSHELLMASYNTPTYKNIVQLAGSRENITHVFSSSVADIQDSDLSPELKAAVMDLVSDVERLGEEAYEMEIFETPPPDRKTILEKTISVSDLLLLKNIYGEVTYQIEEMHNLAATMDDVSRVRGSAPMEEFERARARLNQALTDIRFIGSDTHEYKSVMGELEETTGSMLRESITFKMQEGYGLSSFEQTARAGEMGCYVAIGVLVTMTTMGAAAPLLGASTTGMAGLAELTFTKAAGAGLVGAFAGGTAQTAVHYHAVRYRGSEEMSFAEIAQGAYTEQFKTAMGVVTGTQIGRMFVTGKSIQTESRLARRLQRLAVDNARVSGTVEGVVSNVALGSLYIVTDQVGFSMDHNGNWTIDQNIIGLWALSGALNRGAFGGLDEALLKREIKNRWQTLVGLGVVVSKDLTLEAGEEILETLVEEGYITPDQVLQCSMTAIKELGSGEYVGGEPARQHREALQRALRETLPETAPVKSGELEKQEEIPITVPVTAPETERRPVVERAEPDRLYKRAALMKRVMEYTAMNPLSGTEEEVQRVLDRVSRGRVVTEEDREYLSQFIRTLQEKAGEIPKLVDASGEVNIAAVEDILNAEFPSATRISLDHPEEIEVRLNEGTTGSHIVILLPLNDYVRFRSGITQPWNTLSPDRQQQLLSQERTAGINLDHNDGQITVFPKELAAYHPNYRELVRHEEAHYVNKLIGLRGEYDTAWNKSAQALQEGRYEHFLAFCYMEQMAWTQDEISAYAAQYGKDAFPDRVRTILTAESGPYMSSLRDAMVRLERYLEENNLPIAPERLRLLRENHATRYQTFLENLDIFLSAAAEILEMSNNNHLLLALCPMKDWPALAQELRGPDFIPSNKPGPHIEDQPSRPRRVTEPMAEIPTRPDSQSSRPRPPSESDDLGPFEFETGQEYHPVQVWSENGRRYCLTVTDPNDFWNYLNFEVFTYNPDRGVWEVDLNYQPPSLNPARIGVAVAAVEADYQNRASARTLRLIESDPKPMVVLEYKLLINGETVIIRDMPVIEHVFLIEGPNGFKKEVTILMPDPNSAQHRQLVEQYGLNSNFTMDPQKVLDQLLTLHEKDLIHIGNVIYVPYGNSDHSTFAGKFHPLSTHISIYDLNDNQTLSHEAHHARQSGDPNYNMGEFLLAYLKDHPTPDYQHPNKDEFELQAVLRETFDRAIEEGRLAEYAKLYPHVFAYFYNAYYADRASAEVPGTAPNDGDTPPPGRAVQLADPPEPDAQLRAQVTSDVRQAIRDHALTMTHRDRLTVPVANADGIVIRIDAQTGRVLQEGETAESTLEVRVGILPGQNRFVVDPETVARLQQSVASITDPVLLAIVSGLLDLSNNLAIVPSEESHGPQIEPPRGDQPTVIDPQSIPSQVTDANLEFLGNIGDPQLVTMTNTVSTFLLLGQEMQVGVLQIDNQGRLVGQKLANPDINNPKSTARSRGIAGGEDIEVVMLNGVILELGNMDHLNDRQRTALFVVFEQQAAKRAAILKGFPLALDIIHETPLGKMSVDLIDSLELNLGTLARGLTQAKTTKINLVMTDQGVRAYPETPSERTGRKLKEIFGALPVIGSFEITLENTGATERGTPLRVTLRIAEETPLLEDILRVIKVAQEQMISVEENITGVYRPLSIDREPVIQIEPTEK